MMKKSDHNSPIGSAWVLAASILITYPVSWVTFAQIRSNKPDFKIVHFPEDRSLGQLYIRDAENSRELSYWFHWTGMGEVAWEFLCLYGSHFTDRGMVHVKAIPSLRILSFHEGLCRITDEGLRQIEQLKQFRFLNIYSDNTFSDVALRRLQRNLPNLLSLGINGERLLKIDGKN